MSGRVVRRADAQIGPYVRVGGADGVAEPRTGAIPFRFRGHESARVSFEERHVRAEAADGDFDGQGAATRDGGQGAANERRLSIPPRRDQKDLLSVGEVGNEPVQLVQPVGERRRGDYLAIDEGVLHYGRLSNRYVL